MDLSRREISGRFGTSPLLVTKELAATPITANSTVYYKLANPPRQTYFNGAGVSCTTVAADADGACLLYLAKYDASATAYVVLTGALDLEALTTLIGATLKPLATLTKAQLTLDAGDVLVVKIVNDSAAVTTQPTNLTVTAELFAKD